MPGKFDAPTLDAIERVAEVFAMETLRKFINMISRENLSNTRALIRSIAPSTQTDLARAVHSISFAFEEYGRYQDMRKLSYISQPPIDKLLDWVESKGLAAFGKDPNPYKKKPKSDQRRRNEIAWGIAKTLEFKGRPKSKQRRWFNTTFYSNIKALEEELLLATGDVAIEEMRKSLLARLESRGSNF